MILQPSESPGFLLWRATLRWQRGVARALAPLELTHVQFVLLACTWWLNEQNERPTQVAVAEQAGTDVKMTSQVLRTLEARSLLERTVDPDDTRARRLRVSPQGARLAKNAIKLVEEADARFFHGASGRETTSLLRKLAGVSQEDAATQ